MFFLWDIQRIYHNYVLKFEKLIEINLEAVNLARSWEGRELDLGVDSQRDIAGDTGLEGG